MDYSLPIKRDYLIIRIIAPQAPAGVAICP